MASHPIWEATLEFFLGLALEGGWTTPCGHGVALANPKDRLGVNKPPLVAMDPKAKPKNYSNFFFLL